MNKKTETVSSTNRRSRTDPREIMRRSIGTPAAKLLIVEYRRKLLSEYVRRLKRYGYKVQTLIPRSEDYTPEAIVKQVENIKPDLLIIGIAPGDRKPKSKLRQKSRPHFHIGLEAVELLRKTSDTPVVFINRYEEYTPDSKIWIRIVKTRPVMVTDKYSSPAMIFAITVAKEIREAKDMMRQSEEWFRTVLESAAEAIFIKDTSLRYIHVNPAMTRLLSRPSAEIEGRTDEDLSDPEDAERFKEVEKRVLQGEPVEAQYSRVINGVKLTFLESRVPLRGASGEIIGICGFSRDITDRQRINSEKVAVDFEPTNESDRRFPEKICVAAETSSVVLLLGESGSGKDYFARNIHDQSKQSTGPFLSINCAAVPQDLADSQLFGHEKGAFTGADRLKRGLLELAEGGTLLLNEIGELSLPLQAKLLTFLDTKKITRVGGEKEITVNARLMAATNRNLKEEVESGRFRHDLFHRLNVLSIQVPPLRDRIDELPVIVRELLIKLGQDLGLTEAPLISDSALAALAKYHWPGNVRELRNVLERALIMSRGRMIHEVPLELAPKGEGNHIKKTYDHKSDVDGDTRYFAYLRSLMWPEGSKRRNPLQLPSEELGHLKEEYRTRRHWSIARIARKLGIHQSTLSTWFNPRKPKTPPAS